MARTRTAEVKLEAVAAAKRLHRELGSRETVPTGPGLIDVFAAIEQLGIPLVFKPLKSALGLCLPKPLCGIMVTTERGLHIQRFTAAHELGHAILEHEGSVDKKISYRAPVDPDDDSDLQEIAADIFAAEFMLPRWLYKHHIQRQGWSVQRHLKNAEVVYQLSLRMGASYEATCWGLLNHRVLTRADVEALLSTKVASIKQDTGENFRPGNAWADTWRISVKDDGATLTGSHQDLLRIDLDEAAGSGFQWHLDELLESGFEILADKNEVERDPVVYGGMVKRVLIARPPEKVLATLELAEFQPWLAPDDDSRVLHVSLDLSGKESGGWSRSSRIRRGALPK